MSRFRALLAELPGALMLAVLTAAVTLLLALLLASVTGEENRQHRAEARCYAARTVNMLHDAFEANPLYADVVDKYPPVNTEGLDCSFLEVPSGHAPDPVVTP